MDTVTPARRLRLGRVSPSAVAIRSRGLALALSMLGAACGGPAATTQAAPAAGEWRTFEGNWTGSGTRSTLDLGPDHRAWTFHLNGSLMLTGQSGLGAGFGAEIVGFTDTDSGMVGRAVWTNERGDKVFSELKGGWVGSGNHVTGTLLGGTGQFAGITGEYGFQWQYVLTAEGNTVSGRTSGFKGRARVGASTASPPSTGGLVK